MLLLDFMLVTISNLSNFKWSKIIIYNYDKKFEDWANNILKYDDLNYIEKRTKYNLTKYRSMIKW